MVDYSAARPYAVDNKVWKLPVVEVYYDNRSALLLQLAFTAARFIAWHLKPCELGVFFFFYGLHSSIHLVRLAIICCYCLNLMA